MRWVLDPMLWGCEMAGLNIFSRNKPPADKGQAIPQQLKPLPKAVKYELFGPGSKHIATVLASSSDEAVSIALDVARLIIAGSSLAALPAMLRCQRCNQLFSSEELDDNSQCPECQALTSWKG